MPDRPRIAFPLVVGAFLAPTTLGLVVGLVGEQTTAGALALLFEPMLVAAALYGTLWLATLRAWRPAFALGLGSLSASLLVRVPPDPLPVHDARPEWAIALTACAAATDRSTAPVRLLSWTLTASDPPPTDATLERLRRAGPDILVVHGIEDPALLDRFAAALKAEALWVDAAQLGLVARGNFRVCNGGQQWVMPLPHSDGNDANMVVSFPVIAGSGVIPLVAARLDQPGRPRTWMGWGDRVLLGGQQVAAVAQAIGTKRMIVAGDFSSPATFRRVAGHLIGAGLTEGPAPATWPTHIGPLPLLPLHALERIWAGDSWTVQRVRRLPIEGAARHPIVADLEPTSAHAR